MRRQIRAYKSYTTANFVHESIYVVSWYHIHFWSVVKRDREDNHSGYLTSLR